MLKRKLTLLAVVALVAWPSVGFGQESYQWSQDKVYVSLNSGITLLKDLDFSADLNSAGTTSDVAGKVTSDVGYTIAGSVGYVFSDYFRSEVEFGYSHIEADEAIGNQAVTFTSGGTTIACSNACSLDANNEAIYGVVKAIFTPFSTESLTPLVGGGIGFFDWETEVNSISGGGSTLTVNGKTDDTDFLGMVLLGLEYQLNKNFLLSGRWRHVWMDTGKEGFDDAEADNLVANLSYRF